MKFRILQTREASRELLRLDPALPLFLQPWWLKGVAGDDHRLLLLLRSNGSPLMLFGYTERRLAGIPVGDMPTFTPYLGHWFTQKVTPAQRHQLLKALIEHLPPYLFFRLRTFPEMTDHLPYHWSGWRQTTAYTYRIFPGKDPEQQRMDWRKGHRDTAAKAREQLLIRPTKDPEALLDLYQSLLPRRSRLPTLTFIRETIERKAFRVREARDPTTGKLLGGTGCAIDDRCQYLLVSARRMGSPAGTVSALIGEEIAYSLRKGLIFDFEGSMIRGVERFFRGFGGRLSPYSRLYRARPAWLGPFLGRRAGW